MCKISIFAAIALVILSSTSNSLYADIVVNISETQLGVSMQASGSIDTTLLSIGNSGVVFRRPLSSPAPFDEIEATQYFLAGATGPLNTADFLAFPDSGLGDGIGIDTNFGTPALFLSDTYVANSNLSVITNYQNETLVSLALTPGSYVWDFAGQSVTANVSAIPEPSSFVCLGLLGTLALRRRRQICMRAEQCRAPERRQRVF